MSNEIRTRRLLVTLPDADDATVAGAIELIDEYALTDGFEVAGTVAELDDAPVGHEIVTAWDHDPIDPDDDRRTVTLGYLDGLNPQVIRYLDPSDARKLAALLLAAADEAEGRA